MRFQIRHLFPRLALGAVVALGFAACSANPTSTSGASGSLPASTPVAGGTGEAPGTLTPEMTPAGTGGPTGTAGPATGLIAFDWRTSGSNTGGLATIHADGTGRVEIPDTVDATEPALSPDGSRIAYARGGTQQGIWTMKLDGTDRHRIAHIANASAEGPAWSPDGTRLAFVEIPNGTGIGNREIWLVDADGTHLTKLTDQSSGDRPAWSPDGTRIAFASFAGGGIYSVLTDGKGLAPITGGPDLLPAWAPDGHRLAFQRQDDSNPDAVVAHITVVFSDGTNIVALTQGSSDDEDPCWAPDGSALVYAQFVTTPNGHVVADLVIASANGVMTNLTNTPDVSEYLPSWR